MAAASATTLRSVGSTRIGTEVATAPAPMSRCAIGIARRMDRRKRGGAFVAAWRTTPRTRTESSLARRSTARTSNTCCQVSLRKNPQAFRSSLISLSLHVERNRARFGRHCLAGDTRQALLPGDSSVRGDDHVRCESLSHRWTSTFPGRMDVSTPGAFHYFRTLAEPTVGGISLNADNFLVRELPSLEAEYPGGRRARHRAGGSGGNATPASTIPCVVTKS